jgi:hypothetical protein
MGVQADACGMFDVLYVDKSPQTFAKNQGLLVQFASEMAGWIWGLGFGVWGARRSAM